LVSVLRGAKKDVIVSKDDTVATLIHKLRRAVKKGAHDQEGEGGGVIVTFLMSWTGR